MFGTDSVMQITGQHTLVDDISFLSGYTFIIDIYGTTVEWNCSVINHIDMFVTNGPHNQTGYSNPKYDEIVEKGKGELLTKTKERWDSLLKAEKMLLEDAAIAPLYQRGDAIVQRPKVKGIVHHPVGGDYSYKWAYITEDK